MSSGAAIQHGTTEVHVAWAAASGCARRGRVFQNRQPQSYFASLPWYKPDPSFREDALSDLERSNVATILEYESRVGDEERFIPPG